MMRAIMILGLMWLLTACGTAVDANQVHATRFTLLSIDGNHRPVREEGKPAPQPQGEMFHGYPVLGKTDITDKAERERLLGAMQKGIDDSDGSVAGCFIPRHAIQVVTADATTDYVICFQCLSMNIYETKAGKTTQSYKLTTAGPQRVFDEILVKAGLPRAK